MLSSCSPQSEGGRNISRSLQYQCDDCNARGRRKYSGEMPELCLCHKEKMRPIRPHLRRYFLFLHLTQQCPRQHRASATEDLLSSSQSISQRPNLSLMFKAVIRDYITFQSCLVIFPHLDSESVSPSVTHHQPAGPTSKFCSCWSCPGTAGMLSCCNKVSIGTYTVHPLHIINFHSGNVSVKSNSFLSPTRYPANTVSYLVLYCNRFILFFTQMVH